MIDPIATGILAITAHSPAAAALIFAAGALSSVGPCVAPRYIAIAAVANGYARPIVPTLTFVCGLLCAFMALGFGAGFLGSVWAHTTLLYALLALGLVAGGCVTLARAAPQECAVTVCAMDHRVARESTRDRRSLGAVFILGAGSALVISPCCTPVLAGIVATSTAIGQPLQGMFLLALFALGHALPLFFAGSLASLARRTIRWRVAEQAPAIVGGVLMIALGAYYGILA